MNCTSAGEAGGSAPLVVGGRTFVGFPGAPGWTTTGAAGAACCAKTRKDDKLARVLDAANTHEHAAMLNTTRISQLRLVWRGLTRRKYLIIVGLTLSHLAGTSARPCAKIGVERLFLELALGSPRVENDDAANRRAHNARFAK